MQHSKHALKRSRLSSALFAAALMPIIGTAAAQSNSDTDAKTLDKVMVTGSLIPMTETETATPLTIITAEDLQAKGFTSVADALQQSSFATGGVQGQQTSASFTQGAETLSLFGLSPSYVKYLIDGRPMANYPALYNGSDTFNNISGIPIDLVDRIEILPGGQSSLYGSDAIAGVVNVVLKKKMDGTVITVRGGGYKDGGGNSIRGSFATGFSAADERLQGLVGVQYEEKTPIWGYQRDITKQYYQNGSSPAVASRDFLIYGLDLNDFTTKYQFADPANCGNVTGLYGGTEGLQTRSSQAEPYCGSFYSPGYRTIASGKKSGQAYSHVTFDLNDSIQLYGDLLYQKEKVEYNVGSNYTFWSTGPGFGYFYDPNIATDQLLTLQRAFAPEDMGPRGYRHTMNTDTSESYSLTLGAKGAVGGSNWDYDVYAARTEYRLTEHSFARFADAIDQFFTDRVLGPQLGVDPFYETYPEFSPNYAAFYAPITQAEFDSFTGYTNSRSKTTENTFRAQVTNSSLFSLPGGDAGLAFAVEGGRQSWDYTPDERLLNGGIWGTTAVQGGGARTRYAGVTELRLPIVDMLTATVSGRYDAFKVEGNTIDKPTYSVGLEFRPFETLLIRGKYGTAFKAPTLSDLYQGSSGYYSTVTDYYQCAQQGFLPGNTTDCTRDSVQFFGTQSGSTALKPINADTWNAGLVWSPVKNLGISVDYYAFSLKDEVNTESADGLSLQEYRCRAGLDDINSGTCVNALSKVTRNSGGQITDISTPKVNVSEQNLRAATASVDYRYDIGAYGWLHFNGSYTNILKHTQTTYPGDPTRDLLREPFYNSDPKSKANASIGWDINSWTVTAYANRIGKTPNYQAQVTNGYEDEAAGKVKPFTTYNLSVEYQATEGLELSLMVNNLLDDVPEDRSYPGTSGAPYNENQYNPYGRGIYAEMRYSFGGVK